MSEQTKSTAARIAEAMVPDNHAQPVHHDAFTMLDDGGIAISRRQGRTLRLLESGAHVTMPKFNHREGAVNAL